ncbi:MAG: hypothetical protein Q9191_006135, partial [Dirinaria sp. TL-2023a]
MVGMVHETVDQMDQITAGGMTESPGSLTPTSPHAEPIPMDRPPKLKGRKRLLQSLQRISSSPSLVRMGRAPSSNYRTEGKASMSCVSLSSTMFTPGHSHDNSYSSYSSAGFSTAPTSVASTPRFEQLDSDSKIRIRPAQSNDSASYFSQGPTSVPLPSDLRHTFKEHDPAKPKVDEIAEDYSLQPTVKVKEPKRRPNFDFWNEMPHEVKVQIFQYLKPKEIVKCSIVSKAWHRMCFDGQLWMNIDTEDYYQDISSDSLVKLLTSAGPFVKDLNLRGCVQMRERWSDDGQKISEVCRNLENFSLEGCRIDRRTVHNFVTRNSRLVHINLSGLSAVHLKTMELIGQGCQQLEHLNVSWCPHIDTKGLQKIVRSCPKLQDLRAGEVKGFNDRGFLLDLFRANSLERLVASHCTDLDDESLKLLIQGIDPETDPLTDRPLVPARKFRHLDFSRCSGLSDTGIQSLAHNVPVLAGLELSHIEALTDSALTELLPSVPLLTHLDLEEVSDLTNSTLQTLASSPCAPFLQHLNVSYCENLSDTGVLPVLKTCASLRSLVMDNTRVSDLALTEAAAQLRLRDRTLTTLPPPTQRPKVALSLVVYDCANVTWTGIREVLNRNAEMHRRSIISLKCFYGYQDTVNEHTKRVLRGDSKAAQTLERKWAEYMVATEEAGAGGAGARRRRRRAREAAMVHADEEEGGPRGGRRRARSGGCIV